MYEAHKALARKIFENIWNLADLTLVDEIYSEDYVAHIAHAPEDIGGREAFKQFVALFHALFPDLQFTLEDQIAEDDKIVTRWTARSASVGTELTAAGISIHRLADGRIVESWDNWDALSAMQAAGPGVFDKIGLSL